MIRFLLLIVLGSFVHGDVLSQRQCLTTEYNNQQLLLQPGLRERQFSIQQFLKPGDNEIRMLDVQDDVPPQTTIIIPVVVHVIYNTSQQNISLAQVMSQLDILNRDFRRLNTDTTNTPQRFRSVAADCNIIFKLATVDPSGQPTTGVIRKQTSISGFAMNDNIKFAATGGADAWDSDQYLNIWVGSLSGGVVGYASAPGSDKDRDGVVIRFNAFGNTGSALAPFNRGRTAVHEVGHWLGLIHLWGDVDCGDDLIDDTPSQQTFTTGCPTGNVITSCGNAPNGNMYMNFMDLTDDACTNLFTIGQKSRMRALFNPGGPRAALLLSNTAAGPGVTPPTEVPPLAPGAIRLYPNPATSVAILDLGGDQTLFGQYYSVYTQMGQMVRYQVITSNRTSINLAGLPGGYYYVRIGTAGKTVRLLKTN